MRGKPLKNCTAAVFIGITPADAGKTLVQDVLTVAVEDHPRGCGENAITILTGWGWIGSPPRMRGKLQEKLCEDANVRITPADAGKTEILDEEDEEDKDHPRGCGENWHSALP